jgi:hypothetical protein
MALDKTNKNYYYNLGRVTALVEVMTDRPYNFVGKVFDNANNILPYWLKKALFNDKHNLHKELLAPADVVLMHGEIPKTLMTVVDKNGCFYIGYYQQKAYITEEYGTAIGKEEVTIEHHTPEHIDVPTDIDNTIDDLKR